MREKDARIVSKELAKEREKATFLKQLLEQRDAAAAALQVGTGKLW